MITVPKALSESTISREGETGRVWIESLPDLIDTYLRRWDCAPDGPVTHGGVAVIVPVALRQAQGADGDGTRAIIKISPPHPGNVGESAALDVWQGNGAVRMLQRDDAKFAMLLERVESETLHSLPDAEDALVVAGLLARRLAVPAPPGITHLRDTTPKWEEQTRQQARDLDHGMPARVIDAAIDTIREVGTDQTTTMAHGDLHFGNVLRSDRQPWLAIDPKGYAGTMAFDSATIIRSRPDELLAAPDLKQAILRRLTIFCDAAEVDHGLALRITQARFVNSALWDRGRRQPEIAAMIEHVATVLAP